MAFVKDPGESKRYGRDWTAHLAAGDSVLASTWTVPTGLTGANEELVGNVAAIRLSGGTAGTEYTVTNRVTTTQGDTFERSFTVNVQEM